MSKIQQIQNLSDKDFLSLVEKYKSISSVLREINGHPRDNRLRKVVRDRALKLGIEKFLTLHNKYKHKHYTLASVRKAVRKSLCWSEVLYNVGLSPYGGNGKTIKKYCQDNNISTNHFDKVASTRKNKRTCSYKEIFCKHSKYSRSALPVAVRKFQLFDEKCSKCSNVGIWQEKPLVLQIDHLNGNTTDNRKINLRWLCPNCHSQTPTFCNKKR